MKVVMLACTSVYTPVLESESKDQWKPDPDVYDDASNLTEFAGRQCYESWKKPNPNTSTNEGYLRNIIEQRHFSVLEHGSVTFRISDVSRSLTHELVRHRHMSFSQLSQRYVKADPDSFVVPPMYRDSLGSSYPDSVSIEQRLKDHWVASVALYDALVADWMPALIQDGVDPHRARKRAREAARCVLPNMTPTAIVVTANHRTWREFLEKRGSLDADAEIRELAFQLYEILDQLEPGLYQDFQEINDDQGSRIVRV
jgi:thymidylate synthase (FAD)